MVDERSPHFFNDASGRLTFDLFSVSAADYPALCRDVITEFRLTKDNDIVIGPDQMFWDFRCGDHVVGLEWDNWMGFMVVAQSPEAEPLVRAIAAWVLSKWKPGLGNTSSSSESDDRSSSV